MKSIPFALGSTAAIVLGAATVFGFAAPPATPAKRAPAKPPAPTQKSRPPAARPDGLLPNEYLPVSQLHGGMKGYGLSVFHGNVIDRFDVTVLGVMPKVNSGRDLILVRLGGPNMQRVTDVIAGMSGSPVYISGRLIGAVSYGMRFTREAMGYVTPIEDMLDSWDPRLPQSITAPGSTVTPAAGRSTALKTPITVDGRLYRRLRIEAPGDSAAPPAAEEMVAEPCLTPVSVAGVQRNRFPRVAAALRKLGLEARQGLGASVEPDLKGSAMVPGGAVAMSLMTGDIDMSGIGTLTYRRGDRIVAFGHPFLGIGPVDAPMFTAYIHDVLPSLSESEKIGSPVQMVGAFSQDRPYSIGGRIGVAPTMTPITVHVDDRSIGRDRTYHVSVVRHPTITSVLGPTAVENAIDNAHGMPGDVVAIVDTQVVADEVGTIHHTNRVFDAADIGEGATEDLQTIASMLSSNAFYPVAIRSVKVDVTIERGRHTAQVERIFLPQTRYEAGDTVDVGVVLKPYKGERVYKTLHVRIPPTTAPGTLTLSVQGGPSGGGAVRFGGLTFLPTGGSDYNLATNIGQLMRKFEARERNDDLVAHLTMATGVVAAGGEKFGGLPPNLDAAMRSASRTSGILVERDEVKVAERTDFVLSGGQALPIRVVRHGQLSDSTISAPVSAPAGGAIPSGGGSPTPNTPATTENPERFPRASAESNATSALQPGAPPIVVHAAPPPAAGPAAASGVSANTASMAAGPPIVGRQPGIWRQSATDFRLGTMDGTTLTSAGEIRLAPRLAPVAQTVQPYFWALVEGADGAVYAGSGDDGTIYRIADGKATAWAHTGEVEVQSLVRASDGLLYAGTAPNGRIFRIGPDGKSTLMCQTRDRYVLALALSPDGKTLYAATGGETGRVYALPSATSASTDAPPPLYSGDEASVTALVAAPNGAVYAGTAPNGLVLQIAGPGGAPMTKYSVLYDARETSVSGLAVGPDGALYAATAPHGSIYRIGEEGAVTRTLYDRAPNTGSLVGLTAAPDGTLYTATGSTVIALTPRTGVTRTFDAATDIQILSLLRGADGALLIGTGNTAGIYRIQSGVGETSGTFVSDVLDSQTISRWGQIRWTGTTTTGNSISIETRSGSSAAPDADWSAWSRAYSSRTGEPIASPPARYLQYRATLRTEPAGSGPSLSAVDIYYLTPNQPPQLTLIAPHAGDALHGVASVRWSGTDPDRDTLSYTVALSADDGATWRPLNVPGSLNVPSTTAAPARPTAPPAPTAPLADLLAELDRHPEIDAEMRARILADAPSVEIAPPTVAAQPAASGTDATRATDFPLDTTAFPDGVYRLRVTVTDRPSNPVGSLTDEKVSPEFRIVNHAPRLVLFRHSMAVLADRSVHLEGIAIGEMVAVRGVQFRVDGGDWQAAAADDGIFDGPTEVFNLTTLPLTAGRHVVEVQVIDEAGNVSVARAEAGG